jgi:hypothetical protein
MGAVKDGSETRTSASTGASASTPHASAAPSTSVQQSARSASGLSEPLSLRPEQDAEREAP